MTTEIHKRKSSFETFVNSIFTAVAALLILVTKFLNSSVWTGLPKKPDLSNAQIVHDLSHWLATVYSQLKARPTSNPPNSSYTAAEFQTTQLFWLAFKWQEESIQVFSLQTQNTTRRLLNFMLISALAWWLFTHAFIRYSSSAPSFCPCHFYQLPAPIF